MATTENRPVSLSWSHYAFLLGIKRHSAVQEKHEALVEITLPKNANIHAREYQLYLPSKEELQRKLAEWAGTLPE